jgi:hypothetical protein
MREAGRAIRTMRRVTFASLMLPLPIVVGLVVLAVLPLCLLLRPALGLLAART